MPVYRVVAITGCDSGLGWSIAARSAREGLVTVAGMYNGTDTEAAIALKKLNVYPCLLDVTNPESVTRFKDFVDDLIDSDPNYKLHAIVNNAGVMTIGDFEWKTPKVFEHMVNVNLLGAMRVVSAFLPDLRENAISAVGVKPRIINVASHCGLQPLPGFAAYSASKAGLIAFTKALRLEHRPHGLAAVSFLPGGFIGSSNIISLQGKTTREMCQHLSCEQKDFYQKRIVGLNNYLGAAAKEASFDSLKDERIIEAFVKALTDPEPKELYKVESWRYSFYYGLMNLPLRESMRYWIVKKFINFPDGN